MVGREVREVGRAEPWRDLGVHSKWEDDSPQRSEQG